MKLKMKCSVWKKLVAGLVLICGGAACAGETLLAVDFGTATRRVDAEGKGAFHGVLPAGVNENFAGWSACRATSEVREENGRHFLRIATQPGDAGGQFCIGGFTPKFPGFFRLKVRARTSGGRPLEFGLRLNGAPYTSYSSHAVRSSAWTDANFLFHVARTAEGSVGLYFYTPAGDSDIVSVALETAAEADMVAQIPRPPKTQTEYIRNTRFPLGLPAGWNLGRDCVDATAVADTAEPAADGLPVLKVVSDNPWELWSEPFQTAFPGAPHTATFYYRSPVPVLVAVLDDSGAWAGSQTFPASVTGCTARLAFRPRTLTHSLGLRFSAPHGPFRLDRVHVRPEDVAASAPAADRTCAVALAVDAGEIAAETRIQFVDERAQVAWHVDGAPTGAVLRFAVSDIYGRTQTLPDRPLDGTPRQRGTVAYDVFPDSQTRPYGQFRVGAWVERNGVRLSPEAEVVVTRLPRPVAGTGDAADSPFGGHFNPLGSVVKTLKAGGVNWVRLHDAGEKVSNWYAQEPEKGKWNFHDAEVACYRQNGIKIFAQLGTAPAWATHYGDLGRKHMGYFEKYLRPTNAVDWVNYVTAYVKHHEKNIDEYFVWNEPWGAWWASAADITYYDAAKAGADFAELQRLAYAAVKRVNPAIRVCGFNTTAGTTGEKWTAEVFAAGGFDSCDIVDWHYYTPNPRGFRDDANISDAPLRPIRAVHPNLAGKPFYMSEGQGTSSGSSGVGCRMSGLLRNVPWPAETPEFYTSLADMTCRYILSLLAEGNRRVFLYSSHSYTSMARPPNFLVLLGADGYAHPELVAHAALARMIESKTFENRFAFGRDGVAYSFVCPGERAVAYSELSRDEIRDLLKKGPVFDLYGNLVREDTIEPGRLVYTVHQITE